MNDTLTVGTRWRGATTKHRHYVVELLRVGARSVEFRPIGRREPAGKRNYMLRAAFEQVFAREDG
jgi:hypothetical protein